MKKLLFVVTALLLLTTASFAQDAAGGARNFTRSLDFGVGLGMLNTQGDINPQAFVLNNGALGYSIYLGYNISQKFALRLGYLGGKTMADDNDYASRGTRAYSFSGSVNELHLVGEWSPLSKEVKYDNGIAVFEKGFSPYLFGGVAIGGSSANTKVKSVATNAESGASTSYLAIPIGFGINYRLSEKTKIGLEVGARYTNSDFIDGFSARANAGNKDTYTFAAIKAAFMLSRFNKK